MSSIISPNDATPESDIRGQMEFLSERERKILLEALRTFKSKSDDLSHFKQIREMVPIKKWLENPYYCGPDCTRIYDFWKDVLADIFDTFPSKYNEVILTGSIGIGKCVVGSTRILTELGYVPIESLDSYKRPLGFTPLEIKVSSKDTTSHFYKERSCKTIRIQNPYLNLEGTPEHKILILTEHGVDWVSLDKLKPGDFIAVKKNPEIIFNNPSPKPKKLKHLSERDWGYLVGLFFGDGNLMIKPSGKPARWTYSGQLETITRVIKITGDLGWKKYHRSRNNWSIHLNNIEIAEELFKLGFSGNAYTKKIPEWIFKTNKDFLIGYVSGYIDSDGTVKNIDITSMSESLVVGFKDILNLFGIYPRVTNKKVMWKGKEFLGFRLRVPNIQYRRLEVYPYSRKLKEVLKVKDYYNTGNNDRRLVAPFPLCVKYMEELKEIKFNHTWNRTQYDKVFRGLNLSLHKKRINEHSLDNLFKCLEKWKMKKYFKKSVYQDYLNYSFIKLGKDDIIESYANMVYDVTVPKTHRFYANGIINHNSTIALYGMMRHLYELSCYSNIPAMMGLMSFTQLVFIYFSLTKGQAELTGFGQLRSMLDTIPYFRKEFPRDKKIDSLLFFPPNILMNYGSEVSHSIGMTVVSSILDEANFQETQSSLMKGDYSKVANLYASNIARAKSRMVVDKRNYSISWLVSSATFASSFVEQRISAALNNPEEVGKFVKIVEGRLWLVKGRHNYSADVFFVFTGSEAVDPFIIEQASDIASIFAFEPDMEIDFNKSPRAVIEGLPMRYKKLFLEVPRDFYPDFKINILKALQDLGGISVSPLGKLFTSTLAYKTAISPDFYHPFSKEDLVIATGDKVRIQDFLWPDYEFKQPEKPRFLHIDQSKTGDCTGISSVFLHSVVEQEGVRKAIVGVDFMLRIVPPPPPRQVSIGKIRDFVFYMRDNLGLTIGKISYDWVGSDESLQVLEEGEIRAGHRSVDRTDDAYLSLCNLFHENRILTYDYEPFRKELFNLNHFRAAKKVDHPKPGGCARGNVSIKLVSGSITFKELYNSNIPEFQVYSKDLSGNTVIAQGCNCRITKEVDELITVYLSWGEGVDFTPDHLFLMSNGAYKRAEDLNAGDFLMSISSQMNERVSRVKRFKLSKPEPVYDITVPIYENFALTEGIFVHNSKDVTDSMAGAIANLLDEPIVNLESKRDSDRTYFDIVGGKNSFDDYDENGAMNEFLLKDYK